VPVWDSFVSRRYVAPTQIDFLVRVNRGLAEGWFSHLESLKYRSLQLTGDEKRLTKFAKTKLFGPGKLCFDLLGCESETLPIAIERVSAHPTMLMFENAAPFLVAQRIVRTTLARGETLELGAIAYGAGKQVVKSASYLGILQPG